MFRIDDYALDDAQLAIFEDGAHVDADGFIWFTRKTHSDKETKHNACEILLHCEIS